MATPMITTGTIMGEISTAVSAVLPGNSARTRPTDASVPSAIATTVAAGDTMRLFITDRPHTGEVKNSSYQRSEKPDMGYIRKLSALNDRGTMTRMGRIRKARMRKTRARCIQYQARSRGAA
jgi:hypothetical protein